MQKNDVIYRQQAIDAVEDWFFNTNDLRQPAEVLSHLSPAPPEITEEAVKEYCRKRDLCIVDSALLKKYASAQAERKKGKWIRITQGAVPELYMCPFCHRTVESHGIEGLLSIRYPYCHCGADMRGGVNRMIKNVSYTYKLCICDICGHTEQIDPIIMLPKGWTKIMDRDACPDCAMAALKFLNERKASFKREDDKNG